MSGVSKQKVRKRHMSDLEQRIGDERERRKQRVEATKDWKRHDGGDLNRQCAHIGALAEAAYFEFCVPYIRFADRAEEILKKRKARRQA